MCVRGVKRQRCAWFERDRVKQCALPPATIMSSICLQKYGSVCVRGCSCVFAAVSRVCVCACVRMGLLSLSCGVCDQQGYCCSRQAASFTMLSTLQSSTELCYYSLYYTHTNHNNKQTHTTTLATCVGVHDQDKMHQSCTGAFKRIICIVSNSIKPAHR